MSGFPKLFALILMANVAFQPTREAGAAELAFPVAAQAPLPAGVVARLGSPCFRHGGRVRCLTFSRDGKTLASGGADAVVRLWDATTGRQLRVSQSLRYSVESVDFDPDGETLAATTADNAITLLDASRGVVLRRRERTTLGGLGQNDMSPAVFAPNGRFLAAFGGAGEYGLLLLHPATLRTIRSLGFQADRILFASDGRRVLTLESQQTVRVWDTSIPKGSRPRARTGRLRLTRTKKKAETKADPSSGPLFELKATDPFVCDALFSRDGRQIITAGGTLQEDAKGSPPWKEAAIRIWDAENGKQLRVLQDESLRTGIFGLALSPDGRILAVAGKGRISLWDLKEGKRKKTLPSVCEPDEAMDGLRIGPNVIKMVFAPDGRRLAAAVGNAVCLWDTASGRLLTPGADESLASFTSLTVSRDGRLLAVGRAEGGIEMWNLAERRLIRRWQGHSEKIAALAFAPNAKMLASRARNGTIRFWHPTSGRRQGEIERREQEGAGLAWLSYTRDGKQLAYDYQSEERYGIRFWDAVGGKEMRNVQVRLHPQEEQPLAVALSADDSVVQALTSFDNLYRWTSKEGRFDKPTIERIPLLSRLLHPFADAIAFSHEGTLATFDPSKKAIELRERTRRTRISGEAPTDSPCQLAFTPNSGYLALISQAIEIPGWLPCSLDLKNYTLRVYEIASRREVLRRALPSGVASSCCAFTPDGRYLLTAMTDTTILVWDLFADDGIPKHDLQVLWTDLKHDDARLAHRALSALIAAGDKAVVALEDQLQASPGAKAEQLARWTAELDSDRFAVREQAQNLLTEAGETARAVLERARSDRPSLEMRRRLDALLESLDEKTPNVEVLRRLRTVVVLEHIGTPSAQRLLRRLSEAATEIRLRRAAQAALKRLEG